MGKAHECVEGKKARERMKSTARIVSATERERAHLILGFLEK